MAETNRTIELDGDENPSLMVRVRSGARTILERVIGIRWGTKRSNLQRPPWNSRIADALVLLGAGSHL